MSNLETFKALEFTACLIWLIILYINQISFYISNRQKADFDSSFIKPTIKIERKCSDKTIMFSIHSDGKYHVHYSFPTFENNKTDAVLSFIDDNNITI